MSERLSRTGGVERWFHLLPLLHFLLFFIFSLFSLLSLPLTLSTTSLPTPLDEFVTNPFDEFVAHPPLDDFVARPHPHR